ncbi:MAG: hypothetical protein QXP70_06520, partial [Methanomassiliicoccales archaeon]
PSIPGSNFNVTAYVTDTNASAFGPAEPGAPAGSTGTVKLMPLYGPEITNITNSVTMKPTVYTGIYSFEGKVNQSVSGLETFEINATDSFGYYATYQITLIVVSSLSSSGSLNSSYPAPYLGPTSMTFSSFYWTNENGAGGYYPGFMVNANNASNSPGIIFHIQLKNNNRTAALYLDALSDIYFFFGGVNGFTNFYSFIVYNISGAPTSPPPPPPAPAPTPYPTPFFPSNPTQPSAWTEPISSSFITLLPGQSVNVTFGVSVVSHGNNGGSIPPGGNGGFIISSSGHVSFPTLSTNLLELFGYLYPTAYGTPASASQIVQHGTPYGQAIPFTAIYWYT